MGRNVDLHGFSWAEGRRFFIEVFNDERARARGRTSRAIDVVHGYGSTGTGGTIRLRLRGFLDRHTASLDFVLGETLDSNPGHTVVYPLSKLPSPVEEIDIEILNYCENARAQSKVIGKFRRFGQPEILKALLRLEQQKLLDTKIKNNVKLYYSV